MNDEIKNDAITQDTAEQNQNAAAPAAPSALMTGSELITDNPALTTADVPVPTTNPPIQESSHPFIDPIQATPPDPVLVAPRTRGRPSKVAQLPQEMRALVNEQLLWGLSYDHIIHLLEERGYPGFSTANLSRWVGGGFKHWASLQMDLATQTLRREAALKRAAEKGLRLEESLMNEALATAADLVSDLDTQAMKAKFHENPGLFTTLFNAMSRYSTNTYALERKSAAPSRVTQNNGMALAPRSEAKGGLTLGERGKVCGRLGIPHAPVRNPEAIEPETQEKPSAPEAPTPNPTIL
jgi:hypothetical protein